MERAHLRVLPAAQDRFTDQGYCSFPLNNSYLAPGGDAQDHTSSTKASNNHNTSSTSPSQAPLPRILGFHCRRHTANPKQAMSILPTSRPRDPWIVKTRETRPIAVICPSNWRTPAIPSRIQTNAMPLVPGRRRCSECPSVPSFAVSDGQVNFGLIPGRHWQRVSKVLCRARTHLESQALMTHS